MKMYVSTEARLLAKNFNTKIYKKELEALLADVMYTIAEAAKQGEYGVTFDISNSDSGILRTFHATLEELGYKLDNISDIVDTNITIRW